jgi:hypothetical protein
MTIAQRIKNEQKRLNTLFKIENGRGYYVEDGYAYTRKEFEEKYPVPAIIRISKNDDIDGRRAYLYS